jgi:hypothetical protein
MTFWTWLQAQWTEHPRVIFGAAIAVFALISYLLIGIVAVVILLIGAATGAWFMRPR